MSGPFSPSDVLPTARSACSRTAFVLDVRSGEKVGAVRVPDEVALAVSKEDLNEWISEGLNRLCSCWSIGVVAGRMLGTEGLPLDETTLGRRYVAPPSD